VKLSSAASRVRAFATVVPSASAAGRELRDPAVAAAELVFGTFYRGRRVHVQRQ
jgi:hypothetical protein